MTAINYFVIAAALLMLLPERFFPGRPMPRVAGWWQRALLFNSLQVLITLSLGAVFNRWLVELRPWSAGGPGAIFGALLGYLTLTFIYYWWHRWRHESPLFWRVFHQVHHSPQRIEIVTTFYKHPLEALVNTLLNSAVLYLLLGLEPAAASGSILLAGMGDLFYYWNVKTPHWLGYFFQRPESHAVHHQEGVHNFNYSDLPLWDMLFGTFKNPREWAARCGLGGDKEHRVLEMLAGIDVTASSGLDTERL